MILFLFLVIGGLISLIIWKNSDKKLVTKHQDELIEPLLTTHANEIRECAADIDSSIPVKNDQEEILQNWDIV